MIVEEIECHGGSVLKFAGDALIAEWRHASSEERHPEDISAASAVYLAAQCASSVVKKCSDYPVSVDGRVISALNVHCGVGYGNVVGTHVGDKNRKEYLILGKTIHEVADALLASKQGEVYASQRALKIMGQIADFKESQIKTSGLTPQKIAFKSEQYFQNKKGCVVPPPPERSVRSELLNRCKEWSLEALELLLKQVSCYVHPALLANDFSYASSHNNGSTANNAVGKKNSHEQSQAELRDVFTAFIQPQLDIDLTASDPSVETIECLNSLMQIIQSEVSRFKGQIRQFIVDDKGLVVIANFGLRGSTFPNM